MNLVKLIPLLTLFVLSAAAQELGKVNIASLSSRIRINQKTPSVQFSWKIKNEGRAQLQTSYRILISKDESELKPDGKLVWDSQRVDSFQALYVDYTGPALETGTYYWKAQLTSSNKETGAWSKHSSFVIPEKEIAKNTQIPKVRTIGSFQCSDASLNEIFKKSIASRKKNLIASPSFEPGGKPWGAPIQLTARGYAFEADLADYYATWLKKFLASVDKDKLFPAMVSPNKKYKPAPGYSEAGLMVPFALWQLNGDASLLDDVFQPAVNYVGMLKKNDPSFSGKAFAENRGDFGHLDDPTSPEFLSLCFFALDCRMLAEMATARGHLPYITQHHTWFANIQKGFQKTFLNEKSQLTEKSQTAQILALRYGLLPPNAKQPTADALAARLKKEGLKAGIFGTAAILPVLSWTDHHEQAIALAKSFTEEDSEPSDVALASTSEWMMSFLAGFNHQTPGFKTSRISPFIPNDGSITHVRASHETPYGTLAIDWKTTETGLKAKITIPPNTTSKISLPGVKEAIVSEAGKPLDQAIGCQMIKQLPGRKEIIAQSGTYHFEVKNQK